MSGPSQLRRALVVGFVLVCGSVANPVAANAQATSFVTPGPDARPLLDGSSAFAAVALEDAWGTFSIDGEFRAQSAPGGGWMGRGRLSLGHTFDGAGLGLRLDTSYDQQLRRMDIGRSATFLRASVARNARTHGARISAAYARGIGGGFGANGSELAISGWRTLGGSTVELGLRGVDVRDRFERSRFRTFNVAGYDFVSRRTETVDLGGEYADLELRATRVVGGVQLRAWGGTRFGHEHDAFAQAPRRWVRLGIDVPVTPRVELLATLGQIPSRPELSAPGGEHVSVGLRWRSRSGPRDEPIAIPVRAPASRAHARVESDGPREGRLVLAELYAGRVEVRGDFTDWMPRELRRGPNGTWQLTGIPSGTHRLTMRVDFGEWGPLPALPSLPGDFGGRVSLVVVP